MEISIKIDGAEAGAVSTSPGAGATQEGATGATPPPQVAATAAATGASNAGPARVPPGMGQGPSAPSGEPSLATGGGHGRASAGAAPGFAQDAPQVVVEEGGQ
jgi:hypothetical protein